MKPLIHYDAVAVFLGAVAIYLFYQRKDLRGAASRRFELLLWIALGYSVFSALETLAALAGAMGAPMTAAMTAAHLCHAAIYPAAAWYALSLMGRHSQGRAEAAVILAPFCVSAALVLSNPWTGFLMGHVPGAAARPGPLLDLHYVLGYLNILAAFLGLRGSKARERGYAILFLASMVAAPLAALSLQRFLPGADLECFSITIVALFALFTIQDSSQLADRETGLLNRGAFTTASAKRFASGRSFDVILVRGLNVGQLLYFHSSDEVSRLMQEVAGYLSAKAGSAERVFHLGDESFAILPEAPLDRRGKDALLEQFNRRFAHEWRLSGSSVMLQARVAVLSCPAEAAGAQDILYALEDMGAREGGGPEAGVSGTAHRRDGEVDAAIQHALETGRVGVLYQPIHSVSDGRYCALDSQITLIGPSGEAITQSEIIRSAERTGSMNRLGFLALKTMAAFYSSSGLAAKGIGQIQIRLSSAQCLRSDLPQQVAAITESLALDPSVICFEITESAASGSSEAMAENMRILSDRGVEFALDDYGSGYTDLGYLMELPFTYIKLDKSIITAAFASERGRIILESTVALLRRLGRRIVAEGVETAEQASVLAGLGCGYLQGFHFSPPAGPQGILESIGG